MAGDRPIDRWLVPTGRFVRDHQAAIAVGFIVVGVCLAATAVARKSVTVDEFQVLPHGLAILRTGDFHLDPGVPPLANELTALPLLFTSARLDVSNYGQVATTWECGHRFMEQNTDRYHTYFMYGRAVSLTALCLTCFLTFGFSRSLYGNAGGLLTAALVALSPSLLAHGALVTPDIFLTAGLIGSLWALDSLLRRPRWDNALAFGVALGAASLAKFTGLLLFPIYFLVIAGFQVADRFRRGRSRDDPVPWRRLWLAAAFSLLIVCSRSSINPAVRKTADSPA